MCSILAIASPNELPTKLVGKTPDLLRFTSSRGPDDHGSLLIENRVYLGSNRLSIIDLSEEGRMPLKSLLGNYWITYNGEIYNYLDLRKQLVKEGVVFHSKSDTEVVLNAYVKWGESFVKKLNGIFAFVIFDKKKNKIITARDRFGCKPLYYLRLDDSIVFSSDFSLLRNLAHSSSDNINLSALTAYMQCRFVPGELTLLKDIFKLKPAEVRTWELKSLSSKTHQFWEPEFEIQPYDQETFNQKFFDAVKLTKTADVTPDLLLSGGLDSAAVLAAMNKQGERKFHIFTCAFKDSDVPKKQVGFSYKISAPSIDEREYAERVAETFHFHSDSTIIDSNISTKTFLEMQRVLGEPIASTNALGQYLFAISLKGKTKLAITGTGSDELLGGYQTLYFKNSKELKNISNHSVFLDAFADFDLGNVPPLRFMNQELVQTDYLEEYANKTMSMFPAKLFPDERLNQLACFEMAFGLPGWELDQADRLFMSQSIELRPAFLENSFVDYALTIPSKFKVDKSPLRNAMRGLLPKKVVDRPKYPSLGTPLSVYKHKWFKSALRSLLENPLDIWDKKAIGSITKQPQTNWDFDTLYRLIYLQLWLK